MDKAKQLKYWIEGAESDINSAEILVSNKKYLHGLFFCHLTIEKTLKALWVKEKEDFPPKTHNLIYLIDNLENVSLDEQQVLFLSVLMKYQLEGRYPEYYPKTPDIEVIRKYLLNTKDLFECLKAKL